MFERFTDQARRVLVLAQEEARLLGHDHIGTEHVLLGLLREHEGVAALALTTVGVSYRNIRVTVGSAENVATVPFTTETKTVLELALTEALRVGHNYIGTEHLLLGLLRHGHGAAIDLLIGQGADLAVIEARVMELIGPDATANAKAAVLQFQVVITVDVSAHYPHLALEQATVLVGSGRYRAEIIPITGYPPTVST